MTVTSDAVLEALRRIKGPDLQGNIVDLGLVSDIFVDKGRAYFSITVPSDRAEELEPLRQAAERVVKDIAGVVGVTAVLTADAARGVRESARVQAARAGQGHADGHVQPPPAGGAAQRVAMALPRVKHLVAVASGKGGVGKSTTAVNLALGLAANGLAVGILDADVYGPSQPRLLGLTGKPKEGPNKTLVPLVGYGLEVMSMGFLVGEDQPMIWRGPMVVSALTQMLRQVTWGVTRPLDVLVIDMPPGTGDIQLSMAQQVPLSGAVIVSTPQDLALIDARKGLAMFQKVDVPVLGIIENMSYFLGRDGERYEIFGHGGARKEAERLGVPFLGEIPLDMELRAGSDAGTPIVATRPDSALAHVFRDAATRVWHEVQQARGDKAAPPTLEIVDQGGALRVTPERAAAFTLSAEMLRVMSPSAEVQGHSPAQRVTVGGKRGVRITRLEPVGMYAVRIVFDDTHSTGLYGWSYLQTLDRERDQRWRQYESELAAKGLSRG